MRGNITSVTAQCLQSLFPAHSPMLYNSPKVLSAPCSIPQEAQLREVKIMVYDKYRANKSLLRRRFCLHSLLLSVMRGAGSFLRWGMALESVLLCCDAWGNQG